MQKPQVASAQACTRSASTLDKQHAVLCVDPVLHQCCLAAETNAVCFCRLSRKVAWMLWPVMSVYTWHMLGPSQGPFGNQSHKKYTFYDWLFPEFTWLQPVITGSFSLGWFLVPLL